MACLVAARLGMRHLDADELTLNYLDGKSVRDYYKENGKSAFMEKETSALGTYLTAHQGEDCIISLGGGASDNDALLRQVKANGRLIYLYRKEADILPVILKDGIPPFLDPHNEVASFHTLFTRRNHIYTQEADLIIDLGEYRDKDESAEQIIQILVKEGFINAR